ncbi:condensin-2 complex subunit H2-like [Macrobrachium nipponense]|uniref:condensin-2 complex subunit H2-like n=1 Tax=Macrobrachium nipponense TaxID=159736 RepID=UPI0030C8BC7E
MPRGPQSSPTQDLEARFSVFLNPIRDLTKNWEVDIAKYLEEYLEELAEVQITFDGGETMMNFAEAAMLIQGSATVYSKKVEFLWQMVLQMLDLLSSRRSVEASESAPGAKEGGGGRANLDSTRDFISVDEITEGRNIDMKDDDDDEEEEDSRKKGFKFLPATPLHLVEKEGEKSQHRINLFMKNNEMFGAKDDFRINRSYMTLKGMLCLELPSELLQDNANLLANILEEESEDDGDLPDAPVDDAPPSPMECAEPETAPQEESPEAANENEEADKSPDMAEPQNENPQPMEIGGEEKGNKDNEEKENNNIDVIDLPNGRYRLRKRGEKEAVVTLKLSEPWKPIDPHAEAPAKRPIRAGRLRKPLPCNCHQREQKTSRSRRKNKINEVETDNKQTEKTLPSVESYITKGLANIIDTNNKNVPSELSEEASKELSKRLHLSKQKKVKELLKDGIAQDAEEAIHRVNEETHLQQRLDEQLEDLPFDDAAVDLDDDDVPQPPLMFPNPHDTTNDPNPLETNKRLTDSQFDEPGSEYEALVQKWVSEYITNAQDHVNSSDLTKRVNKWREAILPKLEDEERRREFDIHSYGSQVLGFFPENGRKQTIPFQSVAKNQEAPEVSRLFLSCLMLANTYNVQLNDSIPGDFAMDCLELTLLSRVRHHEELEEYAAPSQSSPTKRKGRVKNASHKNALLDEPVITSNESPNICADITHITIADNIQVDNCDNAKKGRFKKR